MKIEILRYIGRKNIEYGKEIIKCFVGSNYGRYTDADYGVCCGLY